MDPFGHLPCAVRTPGAQAANDQTEFALRMLPLHTHRDGAYKNHNRLTCICEEAEKLEPSLVEMYNGTAAVENGTTAS